MSAVIKQKKGYLHIYTGTGKGKTTAALGLALRAAGSGYKVCFLQFFKDPRIPCGEAHALKKLGEKVFFKRFGIVHPDFKKTPTILLRRQIERALERTRRVIAGGTYDLIVLDEVLIGVSQGFIAEQTLLEMIETKMASAEIILTGRGASAALMDAADYVTDMKALKHPFSAGLKARRGIEF
ncbi:MAG: cob(I)yrinic acid a,c-diamide adenosyltransferase [Candidatus Omnitrophota bacterium]